MHTGQTLEVPGYQVLQYLGSGAKSTIWQIRDRRTAEVFLLKRVVRRTASDMKFIEQATNEYEVASHLDHPVVRKIHCMRRIKRWMSLREIQLVMELCNGKTLQDRRPSVVKDVIRIFEKVAEAMTHMNAQGFVHADIKPNNIMIAKDGTVKVFDLGQSCPLGTIKERIQGTPDFIAPEQVHRRPLDARTDVFNFGAALYWTLTGKPVPTALPKSGIQFKSDVMATAADHVNPDVPKALGKLITDCIAPRPSNRPETMNRVSSRLVLIAHTLENGSPATMVNERGKELVANVVAGIFRQAARLNSEDGIRQGCTVCLDDGGDIIATGDLHGNRTALAKIISYAALPANPHRRLVLQEIVHGLADPETRRDRSAEVLLRAARLKVSYGDQVYFLLGNHDVAELTGNDILKDGKGFLGDFATGVEFCFGRDAPEVGEAIREFLASLPLAIRWKRVFFCHSLPARRGGTEIAGVQIFDRNYGPEDMRRGGPVYEWTWGRGQTPEQLDALAERLDVDLFVLGHQPCETGYQIISQRGIILSTDHEHGCILHLSADTPLTAEDLRSRIRPLATLGRSPKS